MEKKVSETGFMEKKDLKESLMSQAPLHPQKIGRTANAPRGSTGNSSADSDMIDNPAGANPQKQALSRWRRFWHKIIENVKNFAMSFILLTQYSILSYLKHSKLLFFTESGWIISSCMLRPDKETPKGVNFFNAIQIYPVA